ncbi:hypothetical protein C5B94_14240 [Clavibacter michiganensis]|nr:hypothetical protein C5B94_14240 [Clavibacter michiganensis]
MASPHLLTLFCQHDNKQIIERGPNVVESVAENQAHLAGRRVTSDLCTQDASIGVVNVEHL